MIVLGLEVLGLLSLWDCLPALKTESWAICLNQILLDMSPMIRQVSVSYALLAFAALALGSLTVTETSTAIKLSNGKLSAR